MTAKRASPGSTSFGRPIRHKDLARIVPADGAEAYHAGFGTEDGLRLHRSFKTKAGKKWLEDYMIAFDAVERSKTEPGAGRRIENDEVWVMRDGRRIEVQDIEIGHARNILRMILRNQRRRRANIKEVVKHMLDFVINHDSDDDHGALAGLDPLVDPLEKDYEE